MKVLNKILLHLEGLVVLVDCLYFYGINQFSWVLFLILLLSPDLSMFGYFINPKIGAILYNIFHTYIISVVVIIGGLLLSDNTLLTIGLIWTAHIGMDRVLGYGLKYPSGFKETHLNRV